MTHPKWVIGFATLFVLGSLISSIVEGPGSWASGVTHLQVLMEPEMSMAYLSNLWEMMWFQYPFFEGPWVVLMYLGWCVSAGLIVSFVVTIISGISGLLRGIFRLG